MNIFFLAKLFGETLFAETSFGVEQLRQHFSWLHHALSSLAQPGSQLPTPKMSPTSKRADLSSDMSSDMASCSYDDQIIGQLHQLVSPLDEDLHAVDLSPPSHMPLINLSNGGIKINCKRVLMLCLHAGTPDKQLHFWEGVISPLSSFLCAQILRPNQNLAKLAQDKTIF